MKPIFFGLVSLILVSSCGKTSRDVASGLDRVDILFVQLKLDSSYQEYYNLVKTTSEIIMINSKKSGKADTAVLNNRDISWKEKYEQLNYENFDVVEKNTMRMYKLHTEISARYPDFKTLSEEENNKLILISKKHFAKAVKD